MRKSIIFGILFSVWAVVDAGITLADKGKTDYIIHLPSDSHKMVVAAANDLRDYMKKSAGIDLKISASVAGKKIILKQDPSLTSDEFEVKISGNNLVLSGGDHYGVSAAVYAFLENQIGIRWFSWYGDEKVPVYQKVTLDFPSYRKKPGFPVRWVTTQTIPKSAKPENFYRRNSSGKIIPDKMQPIVGVCHTLFWYLPPKKAFMNNPENWKWKKEHYYFKTNPEFYSLSSNKKRVDSLQLCLSNGEMRKEFKKRFSERVELQNRVGAYSLSAMDWPGRFCFCENCIALEKKYKCEGGPFYDFLIDMANFAKEKYPDIYITTLAYRKEQSEKPPAVDKLPDNLIIIYAPIDDNFSKDLSHTDNSEKVLVQWRKIAKHLWIWYYPTNYKDRGLNLYSGIDRNMRDIKIMKKIGFDGMFWGMDVGTRNGLAFADLRQWLSLKMWNDPSLDHKKLMKEFCDFHYGKAADDMISYINDLDLALEKFPGILLWHGDGPSLTDQQLLHWFERFKAMEQKTAENERHLENIKHARIPLDFILLNKYRKLVKLKKGLLPEPAVIHDNILRNMERTLKRRMPTDLYLQRYELPSFKTSLASALVSATVEPKKLPAQFDKYPENSIRRVMPEIGRAWKLEQVPDASFGRAITTIRNLKLEVPFSCGVYDKNGRKHFIIHRIQQQDMVIDKFHYYKIGETEAPGTTDCVFWSSGGWNANLSLGSLGSFGIDPVDRKFEIWAQMKFEGKGYSPQSKSTADNVWIGEVVVIKK